MKKFTQFAFAALLLLSSTHVFADDEKKGTSQKPGTVKSTGENSGLLKGGDLGFKFYTGYHWPYWLNGNEGSYYRYLGAAIDYHITSSLAIEPGFFYQYTYQSTTSSSTYYNPRYGASLGLFYYYNAGNNLYIYSGPRVEYSYHQQKTTDATGTSTKESNHYYGAIAVLGLKYMFNENFGIFGDIGLGYFIHYYHLETTKYTEKQISLSSSSIGVVFYL